MQDKRLGEHGAILEAIRNRDPDGAAKRMSELLADSIGDVRIWFNRRDEQRSKKPGGKLPKRPAATTSA
jgi:DNA-binding FadR family transcriptional regulator